jgi:ferredoxin
MDEPRKNLTRDEITNGRIVFSSSLKKPPEEDMQERKSEALEPNLDYEEKDLDIPMTKFQLQYHNSLKELANSKDWKLISKRYVNDVTKLLFLNPEGKKFLITPGVIKKECARKGRGKIFTNSYLKQLENNSENMQNVMNGMNARQIKYYKILKDFARSRSWELLSNYYINSYTKLLFKCPKNHERMITPHFFKSKHVNGCSVCTKKCPKIAAQNFYNSIEEMEGTVEEDYINAFTPTHCKCKNGHDCHPMPRNIQIGHGMCGKCPTKAFLEAKEEFETEMKRRGQTIKGEYLGYNTPILCNCGEHNYYTVPRYIHGGGGYCSECFPVSAQQGKIKQVLILLGYKDTMVEEYRFPGSMRRYDFKVNDHFFIEADGAQHFKVSGIFMPTIEDLLRSQEVDRDKMQFVLEEGYKMLRFDYTNINVTIEEYAQQIKVAMELLESSNKKVWLSKPDVYDWLELSEDDIISPFHPLPEVSKETEESKSSSVRIHIVRKTKTILNEKVD